MKIRNKKTGEIWATAVVNSYACGAGYRLLVAKDAYTQVGKHYDSLAELNEDWEDYEPAEPLIKDEKIRKAVRAWSEAIKINGAKYDEFWRAFRFDNCTICFKGEYCFSELEDGKIYTIAELCGEEEE